MPTEDVCNQPFAPAGPTAGRMRVRRAGRVRVWVAAVLAAFGTAALPATVRAVAPPAEEEPAGLPLPGFGWLRDVESYARWAKEALDKVDDLTRSSDEKILAEIRGWEGRTELTIAKLEQALTVEHRDSNWRGTIAVKVTVPCTLHYAINLATLGAGDFRWDPATKLLRVRMPDVRLQSVEPDLEKAIYATTACTGMRFQFYDLGDIKVSATRRVPAGAREKGMAEGLVNAARAAGKEETAKLFRKVLKAARLDGDVVVE